MIDFKYIRAELLILIPVLYLIGMGLKKSRLPDRWIPVVLGVSSVVLSAVWILSVTHISTVQSFFAALFTAVTQGVLLAGASVYANQLYKQFRKVSNGQSSADGTE